MILINIFTECKKIKIKGGTTMCKIFRLLSIFIVTTLLFFSIPTNLSAGDWLKIWGPTEFVVVDGENGAVYANPALGSSLPQGIYRWEGQPNVWTPLGIQAKKCVTSGWKPDNALYCLTEEGIIYRYKGLPNSWEKLGGPSNGKAGDIYGGPDRLLATGTGTSQDVFRWDEMKKSWIRIGGPGKTFVVGRSSDPEFKVQVYGQSPDNSPQDQKGIFQWSGGWNKRGDDAGSIFISMSTLFATNSQSGDMMLLNPTGWKRIGSPGNMFAADHKGHLYGLSTDKKAIYRWIGIPNKWEEIGGSADKIFAGWDRLLFATNPDTRDLWFYNPATCPQNISVPDFAGTIITEKMKHVSGKRNLLLILWDPHRPDHPAPAREYIDQLIFGPTRSLKDWFRENSGDKLELERVGVLGWYNAKKPASHYFEETATKDKNDMDGDGFLEGHIEKYTEAILAAAADIDFSIYDSNKDKVLTTDELAIFIIIPQNKPDGFGRPTAGKEYPVKIPLEVQGVTIPWIVEWYAGNPPSFGTAAHELGHLIFNAPDLYIYKIWPYKSQVYSIMDFGAGTTHIDPVEKMKLGWLNLKVADKSGIYTLKDIETHCEALILYHPQRGVDEYFIIENRWRGSSYDAGVQNVGQGILMDGVGIWQVAENPAVFDNVIPFPPTGRKGEWGRLGIRFIRADGGIPWFGDLLDDSKALFNQKGTLISDLTLPAKLVWLDGTRSGFEVKLISDAGPEVQLEITMTCP
jgi:M6 family metalloprotease-like protein